MGSALVATTNFGGHPPEFYADRISDKIISVSETAPEPIKLQAHLYKYTLREVLLAGIRAAMASERSNIMALLQEAGMTEASNLVETKGT
jgi:hypothetical protein